MLPMEWLLENLANRISPDSLGRIKETAARISSGAERREVFTAFSAVARRSGKDPLLPDPDSLRKAAEAVPGWDPSDWTCDIAARAVLLLALPPGTESARAMDQIYETADIGEAVALLKALPLLPDPSAHLARAREGARSNVRLQFEAVALGNPYPAAQFDEGSWNQMVAKALFVGVPLDRIAGLDARGNPDLARMLVDHVYERKAAGRIYDPQLWRCVGPHAGERELAALEEALMGPGKTENRAAALALAQAGPLAAAILEWDPALAAEARSGKLTWSNFRKGSSTDAIH